MHCILHQFDCSLILFLLLLQAYMLLVDVVQCLQSRYRYFQLL